MARFKRVTTTGSHFTVFLEEERLLDEEVFLRGLEEEEEEEEEEEDAPTSPAFLFFAAVFLVGIVNHKTPLLVAELNFTGTRNSWQLVIGQRSCCPGCLEFEIRAP